MRNVRTAVLFWTVLPAAKAVAGTAETTASGLPESLGARLVDAIPGKAFGVLHYQWVGILGAVVAGVVTDAVVRGVLRRACARWLKRTGREPHTETLKKAVRPFGLFCGAAVAMGGLWLLDLPELAKKVLYAASHVAMATGGVWAVLRVVDLVAEVFQERAERTDNKIDDLLVPLIRKSVKVFVVAVGLVYVADSLHIPIVPLLSGLGIGGLAVAFAAKDTIENFFGSVAVILDRPFEVGDWVDVDGVEGTVQELGFRSTRVRTFYDSVITVPNAALVRATVDNYGRRTHRRFKATLGLEYGTTPERVDAFCEAVRELVRLHPYTRKDSYHVYLNGLGENALDVLVYMFFTCPDWGTELRERHRFLNDVLRVGRETGVQFAFPTQTIHVVRPEDIPQNRDGLAGTDAQREGLRAAAAVTNDATWRKEHPAPAETVTAPRSATP